MAPRDPALERALARALSTGVSIGEQRAYLRVLRSVAEESLGLDVTDVLSFVEQAGVKRAVPLLAEVAREAWPTRYRERLSPVLSALMKAATAPKAPLLGSFTLQNPRMADYFSGYVSELSDGLSKTSYENAIRAIEEAQREGLSVGDTSTLLRERLGALNATRADLISRTELIRSSNGASLLQAQESGVVKTKTWITAHDNRVRPAHRALDGTTVGVNESFPNGLQAPGEPRCRCTLTYAIDREALKGRAA